MLHLERNRVAVILLFETTGRTHAHTTQTSTASSQVPKASQTECSHPLLTRRGSLCSSGSPFRNVTTAAAAASLGLNLFFPQPGSTSSVSLPAFAVVDEFHVNGLASITYLVSGNRLDSAEWSYDRVCVCVTCNRKSSVRRT